jgi:hypothetical protein
VAQHTSSIAKGRRLLQGQFLVARRSDGRRSLVTARNPHLYAHQPDETLHDVCPTPDTSVEIKEAMESVVDRTTSQDLVTRKKR